jgi:hypothetical protein
MKGSNSGLRANQCLHVPMSIGFNETKERSRLHNCLVCCKPIRIPNSISFCSNFSATVGFAFKPVKRPWSLAQCPNSHVFTVFPSRFPVGDSFGTPGPFSPNKRGDWKRPSRPTKFAATLRFTTNSNAAPTIKRAWWLTKIGSLGFGCHSSRPEPGQRSGPKNDPTIAGPSPHRAGNPVAASHWLDVRGHPRKHSPESSFSRFQPSN